MKTAPSLPSPPYAAPLILAQNEPHLILSPESLIVLEANEAFAEALGATRTELVGRSVLQWIFSEQRVDFARTVRMAGRHPLPPQIYFQWKVGGDQLVSMEIAAWSMSITAHTQVLALAARPRGRVNIDARSSRLG